MAKRMGRHAPEPAFVAIKDHNKNFKNGKEIVCRLIKPSKRVLGKISKIKLDIINGIIRKETKLQQWKNSAANIGMKKEYMEHGDDGLGVSQEQANRWENGGRITQDLKEAWSQNQGRT